MAEAHQADATISLDTAWILLTDARMVRKTNRDDDRATDCGSGAWAGGATSARRTINLITDAHVQAVPHAVRRHWAQHGEPDLADDAAAMTETLQRSWTIHSFLVRNLYNGTLVLLARAWQQHTHIALRSYVLLPDHHHQVTLLYAPEPNVPLGCELADADEWAK